MLHTLGMQRAQLLDWHSTSGTQGTQPLDWLPLVECGKQLPTLRLTASRSNQLS